MLREVVFVETPQTYYLVYYKLNSRSNQMELKIGSKIEFSLQSSEDSGSVEFTLVYVDETQETSLVQRISLEQLFV